ncbi:hypothetical protein BC830DRAFT_1126583 [Chytriomyces sp. MP71]|nr:hypothetical protein BC830DRAFT_1126583 [Chytriomyces sp. MP71]
MESQPPGSSTARSKNASQKHTSHQIVGEPSKSESQQPSPPQQQQQASAHATTFSPNLPKSPGIAPRPWSTSSDSHLQPAKKHPAAIQALIAASRHGTHSDSNVFCNGGPEEPAPGKETAVFKPTGVAAATRNVNIVGARGLAVAATGPVNVARNASTVKAVAGKTGTRVSLSNMKVVHDAGPEVKEADTNDAVSVVTFDEMPPEQEKLQELNLESLPSFSKKVASTDTLNDSIAHLDGQQQFSQQNQNQNTQMDMLNASDVTLDELEGMERMTLSDRHSAQRQSILNNDSEAINQDAIAPIEIPYIFLTEIQKAADHDAMMARSTKGTHEPYGKSKRASLPAGTSHTRRLAMLGVVIPTIPSVAMHTAPPAKPTHRFAKQYQKEQEQQQLLSQHFPNHPPATLSKRPHPSVQSWGHRFPHPFLHHKHDDRIPTTDPATGLLFPDNDASNAANPFACKGPGFRVHRRDGRVGFELAPMAALGWLRRIGTTGAGGRAGRRVNFGSGPRGKEGLVLGRKKGAIDVLMPGPEK